MKLQRLAFITAAFLLTACGSADNSEASEETFAETAVQTVSETSNSSFPEIETSESVTEAVSETAQKTAEEPTSDTSSETQRMFTERDDLKDFIPFAKAPEASFGFSLSPTPRLSKMNDSDNSYYFANFTFDNEEMIRLLDDAYDVYNYNIQKMNWYFDTAPKSTDCYYATGISYKSFYEYLSGIFTEEFIVKTENGEQNRHGAVTDNSTPPDFKQVDGELYALEIGEGIDPGYLGITFSIQEETDDKIIISGVKTEINSTDTGTEDIFIPDMLTIIKTENGLRLDSFELWF